MDSKLIPYYLLLAVVLILFGVGIFVIAFSQPKPVPPPSAGVATTQSVEDINIGDCFTTKSDDPFEPKTLIIRVTAKKEPYLRYEIYLDKYYTFSLGRYTLDGRYMQGFVKCSDPTKSP